MAKKLKKFLSLSMAVLMLVNMMNVSVFAADLTAAEDTTATGWEWKQDTKTLTLNGAAIAETVTLPDGATIIVNGDSSIAGGEGNAIKSEGAIAIKGDGKLTLSGANGIMAASVSIKGIEVDFEAASCGIQVYNETGDALVELTNVDGSIKGGFAGIYVNGECEGTEAAVVIDGCELDVTSRATSWNNRARKSGITVYVSTAEKVESSITIIDSKVEAVGFDAGLSINNYLGDADATNSASSRINITNSTVYAEGTNGTWSGIFASVLGQHEDADSIITITDSSVFAVSPNTGILTSSQKGESKIILNNSILGASGKTALSMIEETCQAQQAELNNGSTYVQMTPAAIMKGEIVNHDGKTIVATAGEESITYDLEDNYFVIPQGSAVTESFTDGTSKDYTFNNQAGGIGGFDYAKEEIWGYDVPEKWETGDIIIYTPEELIEFATKTQDGTLGDCTGRTVKLGADIDMSGYDWYYRNAEGTIVTDHRIPEFSGIFDGQGFTIKNMSYRDEYKEATEAMPLAFILTGNGTFEDINIDGITVDTVAPARFGGFFDALAYSGDGYTKGCTVSDIEVNADAQLSFGGFAFKILDIAKVEDCHVDDFTVNANGVLNGPNSGRCGGFFATGGEVTPFVACSVSDFVVNAESTGTYLGGFVGGASMTASYTNCDVDGFELNAEAKFSAVGGFAGYTAGSAWGAGLVFTDCDVKGLDIETSDKISVGAGGFIGNLYGQGKSIEDGAHHFINCTTEGTISGDAYAGGFAGWLYGRSNGCVANFENCSAAVNIFDNDYYGAGFVGNFTPSSGCTMITQFTNCTASGDVFAKEPVGSFLDADETTVDGIIGGTYNYDPENVDETTGETNNVAPGYRALDNGDGTWTVFPDNGKEVVKIAFHRWNDETDAYENWRTVEVFKDVAFVDSNYNNSLNYSHPDYRFKDGLKELNDEVASVERPMTYWTDAPDGDGEEVLTNNTIILADMNVYVAYDKPDYVCYIQETNVYYETLTEAVADANKLAGANVIVMIKDIDFDSTKALSVTGDLTIISEPTHEQAHIISRGGYAGTLFSIAKGISLTLDGGIVFDGDNNWAFDSATYNKHLEEMSQQGISIYTAGMDRATEIDPYNTEKASQYFTPEEDGAVATTYMITVGQNGTLNLKDVTIQNNYTPKSGLVNTSAGATVNLAGAQIKHCASVEGSGTVVNASGKITINIEEGTLLDGNHVGGNHGLFRIYSGAVVNMSGGTISNTTGWNSNGVVIGLYGAGSTFNMSGGLITGNSSVFGADNGRNAAVYLHANSTMNMTGGTISFNNGRARGGIDTYKSTSTLNINRADQYFVDGVFPEESGAAAYTASNHPMIVDNLSRANNYNYDVGHSSGNYEHWWVTGGIYTQDVDEYCAEGYICIPYEDTERTDDYIVVPGYRVKYYSVETVEKTDETTGEVTSEIITTLLKKYFHMLPRDKFWYEMDERADYYELTDDKGGVISTWYTEKELTNKYNFQDTKLEGDLNLYGEFKYTDESAVVLTIDMSGTMYRLKMGGKRYVDVAKAKALDFVNQYAAKVTNPGDKRLLAIASFDTDAKVVLNWVDVNTADGLAAAKKAINAMKVADNGKASSNQVCTNFDAGIILTRNLLKQQDMDNKFAIILSDGAPTVTVNNDTDTVGTIKSSFWGDQLDMNGKRYQIRRNGGGWTHPGEVDRTLQYLLTKEDGNTLAAQTTSYGNDKEGIFFIGVGGEMKFKLFYDAMYGTSNGTRTSDVKKKPAAFNYVEALQGFTQAEIKAMTTAGWLTNLANRVGGTYVSATNATALQNEFNAILNHIVNS